MAEGSKTLACGRTCEELVPSTKQKYVELLRGIWNDVVLLQPGHWVIPRRYLKFHEKIQAFKFRADDVVVMTFPRCGTTWTQEILWNMRHNPNLDNPDVEDALFIRSPYLECDILSPMEEMANHDTMSSFLKGLHKYCDKPDYAGGLMFQVAEAHTKPRVIKTHLPLSLLPTAMLDTCKVVYVSRNPMDNVLSAMHLYRLAKTHDFVGTQDDFVDLYVNDLLLYSPYGQHLREAWQRRDHPNMFMVTFEELKKDTRGMLKKLDTFLGTKLTDQQIENVLQQTSFKSMQDNDLLKKLGEDAYNADEGNTGGFFIRQGKAGTWRDKITPEQKAKLDAWIKKNFTDYGIEFKYE